MSSAQLHGEEARGATFAPSHCVRDEVQLLTAMTRDRSLSSVRTGLGWPPVAKESLGTSRTRHDSETARPDRNLRPSDAALSTSESVHKGGVGGEEGVG